MFEIVEKLCFSYPYVYVSVYFRFTFDRRNILSFFLNFSSHRRYPECTIQFFFLLISNLLVFFLVNFKFVRFFFVVVSHEIFDGSSLAKPKFRFHIRCSKIQISILTTIALRTSRKISCAEPFWPQSDSGFRLENVTFSG